jgi:hypothetical protein
LGNSAGSGVTTASNVICIGTSGANQAGFYIGQVFGQAAADGISVIINSSGKLGTTMSSQRFKEDIRPMEEASEAVLALKPVTFRYKKEIDPAGTTQFGLVAEEVEKVNPDLVVRDKEGKPYSVRYDQVNAMLLNEFLKEHRAFIEEHRKVQDQETTIAELKSDAATQQATISQLEKEMKAVATSLKEQDAKIQKVNAQVEMGSSALQLVGNRR